MRWHHWGALILTIGCDGEGAGSAGGGGVLARLVESSGARAAGPALEGLYMGELEIVAYDHRPGEAVQTGQFAFAPGGDWSHDVVVQSGHPAARDVLLQAGGSVDFDDLNGDYRAPIPQEYIDQVGTFEVDLLEVVVYRPGVVVGGEYYGMNAELNGLDVHPLHNYPPLDTIPDHYATTVFAGFPNPDQTVNVFFARDDWFATPVLVEMDSASGCCTVSWSSRPLSTDEQDKLESLSTQGTQRRFYSRFVVIPMAPRAPLDLQAGETLSADVAFDFTGAVDFALTDLAAIAADAKNNSLLYFAADADGVPFGLTVAFP